MVDKPIIKPRNPWLWVPTLYLYQGIPYSIVMTTSTLIYKTMGVSVASLAFWTSFLYLPWTIKLLWSPYVEVVSTKRNWIIFTQIILGIVFMFTGFVMTLPFFFPLSIGLFALAAISSASHDIAADGFYMHALDQHKQTFFVGIRSTFYRIAMLTAMGLLPLVAGLVQEKTGLSPVTVSVKAVKNENIGEHKTRQLQTLNDDGKVNILLTPAEIQIPLFQNGSTADSAYTHICLSAAPVKGEKIVLNVFYKSGSKDIKIKPGQSGRYEFNDRNWDKPVRLSFVVNHNLKHPTETSFKITAGNVAFSWTISLLLLGAFLILLGIYHKFLLPHPVEAKTTGQVTLKVYTAVIVSFFRKPGIIPALLFLLLYRFGEAQSVKIATPFLVDSRGAGGIGLSSAQYGIAYGTLGMIALTVGGIIGGLAAAKYGLKKLIWFMALSMNIPNLGFLYLATVQPLPGDLSVYLAIILEQVGYGFGFTAYMLFMLQFVGESQYKTAEYALCTSIMAFGMMIPGMVSGLVQEWLGYSHFFIYVLICTVPGMALIPLLKIDPQFGKKKPV